MYLTKILRSNIVTSELPSSDFYLHTTDIIKEVIENEIQIGRRSVI